MAVGEGATAMLVGTDVMAVTVLAVAGAAET